MTDRIEFHGHDVAPFSLGPADVPVTPRGRFPRLHAAAAEALPRALARREETLAQTDVDPVLLVCAPDCAIGRRLITAQLGSSAQEAIDAACAVFVFALPVPQFLAHFGQAQGGVAAEIAKIGAQPGDALFVFAVNGQQIEPRVMRKAEQPQAEQPATGAGNPAAAEAP